MFPFIISFSLGTFSVFFPFSCFFLLFPHSLTPALVVSACLCSHDAVLPVFIIFLRVFSSEAPLLLKPLTCIFQAGGGGSTSWNSAQKLLLRNPYKQLLVPCWEGKFASSWRNLLSSYSTLKKNLSTESQNLDNKCLNQGDFISSLAAGVFADPALLLALPQEDSPPSGRWGNGN